MMDKVTKLMMDEIEKKYFSGMSLYEAIKTVKNKYKGLREYVNYIKRIQE